MMDNADGRNPSLEFLPVNQASSPPQLKRRRAFLSCESCRQRKSRCVPAKAGYPQPCQRCVASHRDCEFRSTRNTRPKPSLGQKSYQDPSVSPSDPSAKEPSDVGEPSESVIPKRASLNDSLPDCLDVSSTPAVPQKGPSGAVDTSARARSLLHEVDPWPPQPQTASLISNSVVPPTPNIHPPPGTISSSSGTPVQPTARSRIMSAQLHNTADALDLLTFTAAGEKGRGEEQSGIAQECSHEQENCSCPGRQSSGVPASCSLGPRHSSEGNSSDWNRTFLIRKGILTKNDMCEYLDFYFETLWRIRPVIHPFFASRSKYPQLASDEPLLLACLVAVASRYHSLAGPHGAIKSERIHWQVWSLVQKDLQSALWGSSCTRSPGTIAAMLILIEWHPKSINNPLSFSGVDDTDAPGGTSSRTLQLGSTPESLTSLTNQQRHSMAVLLEELNIVAPAYRSNKMSRMLLCNAIGLAQDGCCFELDTPHYATPAPLSSDESLKQQWNQILCVFLYLADESLATRLGLDALLAEKANDAVRSRFSMTFANNLPDGALWESYYEISLEVGKARDLLKFTRYRNSAPDVAKLLPELQHIDRALNRWKRQHSYAESTDSTLLKACVDIERDYSIMYCFAPAIQASTHHGAAKQNVPLKENAPSDQRALSTFASKATQASRQILTTVVETLQPARLISYLPVRCWLCIVAAYLHLLKTTLLANPSLNNSNHDIQLFRASIAAIRHGSPDDTHMAVRYAKFLEILLNASLHSSRVGSPARDTRVDDTFATGVAEDECAFPESFFSTLDFPTPNFANALEELGGLVDWADGSFGWGDSRGVFGDHVS